MSSLYLDTVTEKQSVGALALGSFDGVHRGHLELLQKAVKISKNKDSEAAALCFSPNPKLFFSSAEKPFLQIYDLDQNIQEIEKAGVDSVLIKNFDEACSQMTAENFLDFVYSKVDFKDLVVGFDFKFGKDRTGGQKSLQKWCTHNGVELYVIEAQFEEGKKISSTRVKSHLLKGEVKEASYLLGREHYYVGKVRSDQGLGKKIGFPTLNIPLELNTAIAYGVYVSVLKSKNKTYFGLSNLGLRPTIFESAVNLVLETHILNSDSVDVASGDLISVELKQFLRFEQKFASIEELKSQIASDIITAQSLASFYKG